MILTIKINRYLKLGNAQFQITGLVRFGSVWFLLGTV